MQRFLFVSVFLLAAQAGIAQTPAFTSFGQGCNPARISIEAQRWDPARKTWVNNLPRIGKPFGVRIPALTTDQAPFCILGGSNRSWLGLPLPLPVITRQRLHPYTLVTEYGSCLLVRPTVTFPGTRQGPYWTLSVILPLDPALLNTTIYMQWATSYRKIIPMPGTLPMQLEEGFHWSRGAALTFGL